MILAAGITSRVTTLNFQQYLELIVIDRRNADMVKAVLISRLSLTTFTDAETAKLFAKMDF